MKLTSMKLDKKKSKDDKAIVGCCEPSSKPEFPYGLRITLEQEQIKKLGGLDCDVGDIVGIQAAGEITSVRKEKYQNKSGAENRHTIEIQITSIDVVTTEGEFEKAFDKADDGEGE
jgi:hypothetical protein